MDRVKTFSRTAIPSHRTSRGWTGLEWGVVDKVASVAPILESVKKIEPVANLMNFQHLILERTYCYLAWRGELTSWVAVPPRLYGAALPPGTDAASITQPSRMKSGEPSLKSPGK